MKGPVLADSLGFLAPQMARPLVDADERPRINLIHTTSVRPWTTQFQEALAEHDAFKRDVLSNPGFVHVCSTEDLHSLAPGSIGVVLGMQHAPWGITRLEQVMALAAHGVSVMSLAYKNERSPYASGYDSIGGLSADGRQVMRYMALAGIVLDVSHLNEQSACEALKLIEQENLPMTPMASHSGSSEVNGYSRYASLEVTDRLTCLKGYQGVPLLTFMTVCEPRRTEYDEELMKQFRFLIRRMGRGMVGIGSDCVYANQSMADSKKQYDAMVAAVKPSDRLGVYFPDRPEQFITDGRNLMRYMRTRLGATFGNSLADGLCGQNFVDYLARALPDTVPAAVRSGETVAA